MPCPTPITLTRQYAVVSHSTGELMYKHEVPCGQCYWCMRAKSSHWRTRLILEELHSETPTLFVTLTYEDDKLPSIYVKEPEFNYVPALDPLHLRNYLKYVRKTLKQPIRYFAIGEYGGETCRPHYHILFFNYPRLNPGDNYDTWSAPLQSSWSKGNIDIRTVTTGIVSYLSGYHALKYGSPKGWPKPFMRCSKGIGLPTEAELDYIRNTSENGNPNMSAIGAPGGFHSPYTWNKLFPFDEIGAYAKSIEDFKMKLPDDFDPEAVGTALLTESMRRKGKFDGTKKESIHGEAPPRIISKTW